MLKSFRMMNVIPRSGIAVAAKIRSSSFLSGSRTMYEQPMAYTMQKIVVSMNPVIFNVVEYIPVAM